MASRSWSDAEAIAAGLYDAPGSSAARDLAKANEKLKTGASDLFNNSWVATPGAGDKGSTKVESNKAPSIFSDPIGAFSSALGGIGQTDGKADVSGKVGDKAFSANIGSGVESTLENWVLRIIVVILGFIFVAAGLSMFGIRTPVVQGVIKEARDKIPK